MVKNPPANAADVGSIPGLGRFPGEGNGNPFQYSCLENSMDRGAWQAIVNGFTRRWISLSDWTTLIKYKMLSSMVLLSPFFFQLTLHSLWCRAHWWSSEDPYRLLEPTPWLSMHSPPAAEPASCQLLGWGTMSQPGIRKVISPSHTHGAPTQSGKVMPKGLQSQCLDTLGFWMGGGQEAHPQRVTC